ncbi:MAG: aldehyde dehydrogenase family protein, partial [Candidatus Aminicenantes bacterium]
MEKYQNLINGHWCDPISKEWMENINPADRTTIGLFPRSDKDDIEKAASAASKALKKWRLTPAPVRAEYLFKAAEYLEKNKTTFARELCLEMGKPYNECLGDVREAIDMTKFCAGEGRRNLGFSIPSELPNRTVMCLREPIGVVGAITPWNFPMAMPAWKVMPALITGNTVILKPAEDTPQSAVNLIRAFDHADLPPGVLNLVMGVGEEAGYALVLQKGVDLISFTGSTQVGTLIAEKCPKQYKRAALEMGGKNVIIVLADADIDWAVEGIVRAVFGMAGQRCTSAGRLIIEEPIIDSLTKKIVAAANNLKLGNGLKEDTDIGPIINGDRLATVHNEVSEALKDGAALLCGGEIDPTGELKNGFFYKPTLLANVTPDMKIFNEETFGPVAFIIPAKNYLEAVEIANNTKYGLSGAVYTQDIDKALFFSREVRVGAFFVNTPCIGAEVQFPFGGMKASGNGRREGSHHMLDIYSEWKTIAIQQKDL